MNIDSLVARITSDNDQYEAAAREWVAGSNMTALFNFWLWLQQDFKDPNMEYASRLAAIALAPMLAEKYRAENGGKADAGGAA